MMNTTNKSSLPQSPAPSEADILSINILPSIFGFLDWKDILHVRVCKKWRDAATETLVSPSYEPKVILDECGYIIPPKEDDLEESFQFNVCSGSSYAALEVLKTALPKLQQIHLSAFEQENEEGIRKANLFLPQSELPPLAKFMDGEDRNVRANNNSKRRYISYDVIIITNFKYLRNLIIEDAPLNGKYNCIFNLPNLRDLSIFNCNDLIWDLDMLSGLPLLEELHCENNAGVSGDIMSLAILKDTLRELTITKCDGITGDIMSLASFPNLEELDLDATNVDCGSIRQLDPEMHFPKLESLHLPKVLERIDQAQDFVGVLRLLTKRVEYPYMTVGLADDSPDRYEGMEDGPLPPLVVEMVKVGSRIGWRWTNDLSGYEEQSCGINWMDEEPLDGDHDGFEEYQKELQEMEGFGHGFFNDFTFHPPNEKEYNNICTERKEEARKLQEEFEEKFRRIFNKANMFCSDDEEKKEDDDDSWYSGDVCRTVPRNNYTPWGL